MSCFQLSDESSQVLENAVQEAHFGSGSGLEAMWDEPRAENQSFLDFY